jgi:hypothetical protein
VKGRYGPDQRATTLARAQAKRRNGQRAWAGSVQGVVEVAVAVGVGIEVEVGLEVEGKGEGEEGTVTRCRL